MKAIWNGQVLAESDDTVVVEGNHYFPPDSVEAEYLVRSDQSTLCPWKGTAGYHSIEVDGRRNDNAAWFYPDPTPEAEPIRDHVAFWNGVEVVP